MRRQGELRLRGLGVFFRPPPLAQVATLSVDNNKSRNYSPGVCLDFYQGTIELEFFLVVPTELVCRLIMALLLHLINALGDSKKCFVFF